MLARLFNNLTVQSLASSLIVSILLVAAGVFLSNYASAVLYLPGWSVKVEPIIFQVSTVICLPLYSVWFNGLLIRLGFLKGHHYLIPVLSVLMLLLGCYQNQPEILLAIPMLILIIQQILQMINAGVAVLQLVFNIGFCTGILSLFFPPGLIFILICWVAILLFGHFSVRGMVIPLLGLSAFYFLLYSFYFFFTKLSFASELWELIVRFGWNSTNWNLEAFWPYSFLIISAVVALIEYVKALNHAKIQKRQFLNFNLVILSVSLISFLLLKSPWAGGVMMAFPLAVFLANLIQYVSKWWMRDLVYLSLIATLFFVIFQVGNFLG